MCVCVCLFVKAGNSAETVATRERGTMSETMNERRMKKERASKRERERDGRRSEAGCVGETETPCDVW